MKDQLQKELKEKVKEGVKPSDLKKLKRSKSDGDLPKTKTQPLKHSKSTNEIPLAPSSSLTKIKELEDRISVLELRIETKDRELTALENENKELQTNPPTPLLTDQLNQKQKQIEELRAKLETKTNELKETKQQLDNSLEARHEAVKQFSEIYDKLQEIKQELNENVEQASDELVEQDEIISDLRVKINQLKTTKEQQLKDLKLAQRLAELRSNFLPTNPEPDYLKYALYGLVAVWFISLLNTSWKITHQYE